MLNKLLNLQGVQTLDKEEQQTILGGGNCCLGWCARYCQSN